VFPVCFLHELLSQSGRGKKLKVDDEEEGKVSPSRELYRIRGVDGSWVLKSE